MAPRILFVFTSANKTLTGSQTVSRDVYRLDRTDTRIQGFWLSEAAHPYYVLAPNFEIDFASPQKTFPVDSNSVAVCPILSKYPVFRVLTYHRLLQMPRTNMH